MNKQVEWQKRMNEFEKSGETVIGFCAKRKISVPSFYSWRNKLVKSGATKAPVVNVPFNGSTTDSHINELRTQLSDTHAQIIRLKMTIADLVVKNDVAKINL